MSKIKKALLFFLVIFIGIAIKNTVSAGTTTYVYNGAYGYTTVKEEIKDVALGVKHIINKGTGISNNGKTLKEGRLNHLFVADIKNNDSLKLVTWAVQKEDGSGFVRNPLLSIAKDYEDKHPGWIILAGVNADQYYTGFGTGLGSNGSDYFYPQPYYPYVSSGDNLFVYSPYANCNNVVGFKNSRADVQFEYGLRSVKGLYIHVYDENNNEIGVFKAKDLNVKEALGANESTILAPYTNSERTLTPINKTSNNGFYVVENPELSYVSNSVEWTYKTYNVNAFFGKGSISKIASGSVNVSGTSFAIETTDEALKAKLNVGTYVKCQYEFDDGFNNIEEASGFHTAQIVNGVVQEVGNSYNTRNYPRTVFGCDDEGKVYLITTEKSTEPKDGLYAQEMNALMLQYGITNAFQCDGGGSVQSVCRNEKGILEYAQSPYEGAYRSILSGQFIAMRVEKVKLDISDVTENSVKIAVTDEEGVDGSLAVKLSYIEDERTVERIYDLNNNKISLNNLIKSTEYSVQVMVKKDGKYRGLFIKDSFTTTKEYPKVNMVSIKVLEDYSYEVELDYSDNDNVVTRSYIVVNKKKSSITLSSGKGKIIFQKGTNIFDLKVEFNCYFSGDNKVVSVDNYDLSMGADVYQNYIKDKIDNFFNFE